MNLKQYRRLDGKWQFVAVARKGDSPDPRYVVIGGEAVKSEGGTFYLDWRENGKRKTEKIGTDPKEAKEAWTLRSGIRSGEIEDTDPPPTSEPDKGLTIDKAIENYLVEVQATKSAATHRQYKAELAWFRSICGKKYVSELSRADAMALFAKGRQVPEGGKALNQKTINRKVMTMIMGMRNQGAIITMKKGDWPDTTDKKIKKYEPEEIAAFFSACDAEERLVFQVFLATGFREMEVASLYWSDIDWRGGKLSVSAKPELEFTPKRYEERSVPVPRALIDTLAKRKMAGSKSLLVFPSTAHPTKAACAGGKLNNHFLEMCKQIGYRTGLNCGRCTGTYTVYVMESGKSHTEKREYKCETSPRCEKWQLHRWRHTYATSLLHDEVDIRTVQLLLGHKNIATTEKYLKDLRLDKLRVKIEASTLAAYM